MSEKDDRIAELIFRTLKGRVARAPKYDAVYPSPFLSRRPFAPRPAASTDAQIDPGPEYFA